MISTAIIMPGLAAAGAAAGYALANYGPAMVGRTLASMRLRRLARGRMVLTYDDGPGPLLTPPLLDLLASHSVRASFFLVGFRAERFPETCDRIAAAGHDLGCHTQWHRNAWKMSPLRSVREVTQGYRTMSRWMRPTAPFRPPFGKVTTLTWLALQQRGAPVCWWTMDGCDTRPALPDPARIVERLRRAGGGVVLLHSHDRGADRQEYVLRLTNELILAARRDGYEICTMSNLLRAKPSSIRGDSDFVAASS